MAPNERLIVALSALMAIPYVCLGQMSCTLPDRPAATFVSEIDIVKQSGQIVTPADEGSVWKLVCDLDPTMPATRGNVEVECNKADGTWSKVWGRCVAGSAAAAAVVPATTTQQQQQSQASCRLPNRPSASFESEKGIVKYSTDSVAPAADGREWTMICDQDPDTPTVKGNARAICSEVDSTWDKAWGRCVAALLSEPGIGSEPRIDCGEPPAFDFGFLELINDEVSTTQGARRNAFCNAGYVLSGPSFTICQADGAWSEIGSCNLPTTTTTTTRRTTTRRVIQCGEPSPPANGEFVELDQYAGYRPGDQRKISCFGRFQLRDPSRNLVTCQASGEWDNAVTCVRRLPDCGALPAPPPGASFSVIDGDLATTQGSRRRLDCLRNLYRQTSPYTIVIVCDSTTTKWLLYEVRGTELWQFNGDAGCYARTTTAPRSTTPGVDVGAQTAIIFFVVLLILGLTFIVVYGTIYGWFEC